MRPQFRLFIAGLLFAGGLFGAAFSQEGDVVINTPAEGLTQQPDATRIDPLDDPNLFRDAAPAATVEGEVEIETVELPPVEYEPYNGATLRALDKITGRSTDIDVGVGRPVVFGSLRVGLKACYQTPPELPPEAAAFLEIDGVQATQADSDAEAETAQAGLNASDEARMFSGWMFASSPGLSALEHPVYDIWVIRCSASSPVSGASGE